MSTRTWPHLSRLAGAALALLTACLPADNRATPGSVLITVERAGDGPAQWTTEDGWTITYDRWLVSLDGSLDGDGGDGGDGDDRCSRYNDTFYTRIVSMLASGPQKVAQFYGLGSCDLSVHVSPGFDSDAADTVLGEGVSEADRVLMTTLALDPFSSYVLTSGVSTYLEGTAVKGAVTKRFAWSWRRSLYASSNCVGESPGSFPLVGGQSQTVRLPLQGSALWRSAIDDATLRFEPFAQADADGDDVITLDELQQTRFDASSTTDQRSLAEHVYQVRLPRLIEGSAPFTNCTTYFESL